MELRKAFWPRVSGRVLRLRRRADVALLGDSNTLVSYVAPWSEDRWSRMVARETGLRVLNLGRDGATVATALDKEDLRRGLSSGARQLVLGYGLNDALVGETEDFARTLADMVGVIQRAGRAAYLVTPIWLDHPAHYSRKSHADAAELYAGIVREVAVETGARLIDMSARVQAEAAAGNWDVRIRNGANDASQDQERTVESTWFDNVHYNRNGCRLVAEEVIRALREPVHIGGGAAPQ